VHGLSLEPKIEESLGFRVLVYGLGFKVFGFGFRVEGLGFRVQFRFRP